MSSISTPNSIFDIVPAQPGTERFDSLFEGRGVVIERIVSSGSQPAQGYCQPHDEWVLLLRGCAQLRIAGAQVTLNTGEFIHLPANTAHEVVSTTEDAVWLAVHLRDP